jgi:hypothetical protein
MVQRLIKVNNMANVNNSKAVKAITGKALALIQVQAIALTATAAPMATPATVPLGKYAKAATASGVGFMPQGGAQFTLGAWPRSSAAPVAPAMGATASKATVAQSLWLAARQAGATANKAVSAQAIGQAALTPATPANVALMATQAAQRAFKGQQYLKAGQACGLWLQGYIGPNKGAACIKLQALKAA